MKKNHITRTIIASAVLFSFNAAAATSYFEARNDAMGGTGVASSHYGVAPLANPALLTKHNSNDDFSLLLPSVGAQVADWICPYSKRKANAVCNTCSLQTKLELLLN